MIGRVYDWRKISQAYSVTLSLLVYRLTGNRKIIKLFHRSWAGKSHDVVTKQINSFSSTVQNNIDLAPKNISKGHPTHMIIDNSDGQQQSLTCLATTHRANASAYNPKNQETAKVTRKMIDGDQGESHLLTRKNINDYEDYKIGKPSRQPVIESYTDHTRMTR